ncbi:MAG TPA: hypothetical protein VES79_03535 [Solirubrobacteraceae bacterium]|nr:hypothetical protein [Solirubrobacteraceae bacterium]
MFQVPWYATVFRADSLEVALAEIAPVALRYGATDYSVYRASDDGYKFLQMATFERKVDYELYWNGEEFAAWRADYSSWYQVPVVYTSSTLVVSGRVGPEGNSQAAPRSAHA